MNVHLVMVWGHLNVVLTVWVCFCCGGVYLCWCGRELLLAIDKDLVIHSASRRKDRLPALYLATAVPEFC